MLTTLVHIVLCASEMFPAIRLPAIFASLVISVACAPNRSEGPNGDKADDVLICPANAELNSAAGSHRRCVDPDSGRFVATACCAEVCAGADWREQTNGTVCAWGDDPGDPSAQTGQFAPRTCCDLNDRLSCEVAEMVGGGCEDIAGGREVAIACCESAPDVCHPGVASELRDCVDTVMEESASDVEVAPMLYGEALALCASEGDLQGPMLDSLCLFNPDSEFCLVDFETFSTQFVSACETQLLPEYSCVFGLRYRDIFENSKFLFAERSQLVLADAEALPADEQARILFAIGEAAFDANLGLQEAFEFADDNEVNKSEFWDGSNDLPFVAYEFGAGDNSFGAIFHADTGVLAARIIDGDLYDGTSAANLGCEIEAGPGWAACSENADCGGGLTCYARINHPTDGMLGKCLEPSLAQGHPDNSLDCASNADCSFADGLLCSGLSIFDTGFCRPAWMFGSFSSFTSSSIPANSVVEQDIYVYGLATVPEDAHIKFSLSHADVSALNISVIPAGRDNASLATVFTGATDASPGQTSLSIDANLFHPGDEDLNGRWTLHIENTGGATGSVSGFQLDFSSRFE